MSEARSLGEYWALQTDPVFQGQGVPHGSGQVLLIPGLFANDLYMHTANIWLRRLGYSPIASDILWNVGCPKKLLATLKSVVERKINKQESFSIIGHSRGGLLAKALSSHCEDQVTNLFVVGSPLGGMLAAGPAGLAQYAAFMQQDSTSVGRQFVFQAGRAMTQMIDPDCKSPACDCAYTQALFQPLSRSTTLTSIYSPSDPIVPPTAARIPGVTNIEVEGSHSGLMFNKEVYTHLASTLAS